METMEELKAAVIEKDAQVLSTHEDLNDMEITRTEESDQLQEVRPNDEAAI